MYKISVPIMLENIDRAGRDDTLKMLRELDAERVFLALPLYTLNPQKRADMLSLLKKHCDFFKAEGFEVGAWGWTFWLDEPNDFTHMVALDEKEIEFKSNCCPTDEAFVDFSTGYFADIAACGVDLIMFDDDFRFSFVSGHACCICPNHMKMIEEITGEKLSREELARRILSGGKNKYRDAYLKCNGISFENFARRVRERVDEVNPRVRIGACACVGSWDIDGTDARRLAHILAGKTKPFLRLIGAPYWGAKVAWGNYLQDAVELERMESSWTRDGEIELIAEGDAYPRPRISCPASYLEGFDLAIRASGATDGILKYAIDYTSSAKYEQGYVAFHKMNRPLYSDIDGFFKGKSAVGVRIYEFPKKVAEMDMGENPESSKPFQNTFFCTSERSLAACSIPTVYEGEGVTGACFGQSARYLTPEMRKKGMIIDAEAAKILHTLGVDVGIESLGGAVCTASESFTDDGEITPTYGINIFDHKFKDNIKTLSYCYTTHGKPALGHMTGNGGERVPMSYLYENDDGERYLVLNADTRYINKTDHTEYMRNYKRSAQYADSVEWLSRGEGLPAFCFGNPHLYTMVKEGDGAMSVGLWNFFADLIIEPVIQLNKKYEHIRFLNCDGKLEGNRVTLTSIPAFGFAAFEVR